MHDEADKQILVFCLKQEAVYARAQPVVRSQVYVCKGSCQSVTQRDSQTERGKYKNYTEQALSSALKAIDEGKSYRIVSEMYNIPRTTLHDHYNGKVQFGSKPGPNPYLSFEEEEELASFLINAARIGFPHTKKKVFAIVERVLEKRTGETNVTNGWWERFLQRHSEVTLKSAVPLGIARAKATDPDVLSRYFDILEDCLRKNEILNNPSRIFNCDETGLAFNPPCFKVVGERGSKELCHVTSGDKSKASIMAFVGATGIPYPPMVIFGLKTYNTLLAKGHVPGTSYALSEKSWINGEIFKHWFEEHFLRYTPATRPVLLLLDGHSSHYSPSTIRLAAENQVILFVLPPHTTHVTQPLDRCCFSPLKAAWRHECHNFYKENPGRCVTKYDFSGLFNKAWTTAMTGPNITSGFKATGVCPFDRNAISLPSETPFTKFRPETLVEQTGISYIPLYSPASSRSKSVTGSLKSSASSTLTFSYEPPAPSSSVPVLSNGSSALPSGDRHEEPLSSPDQSVPPLSGPPPTSSSISKFFPKLTPCNKLPGKKRSAGVVIMDWEYQKSQEEKLRKKELELAEKERKKLERDAKKAKARKEKQGTCAYTRFYVKFLARVGKSGGIAHSLLRKKL